MKLSNCLTILAYRVILSFGVILTFAVVAFPSYATESSHIVIKGQPLDATNYKGFKLFRNWCARCHGTYGQGVAGSSNLVNNLKLMSKDDFYDIVENGKEGTMGNMPAWKDNAEIMENRDKIYTYLKTQLDSQ